MFFIEELQQKGIKSLKKKVLNKLLNKALIDHRLINILKTQFFLPNNLNPNKNAMHKQTHSIILTNGGTGKSSVLGIMGTNLDNSSNAGIFGYYSTNTDKWNSGVITQTSNSIIIDEINELINTSKNGDGILRTMNKPLENGSYTTGKAGGRSVYFGNQFCILGNIDEAFNFENFMLGNPLNSLTLL